MRSISAKLAALLIVAALIPITVYGAISILSARRATEASITEGNRLVAIEAAGRIDAYVAGSVDILRAIANDIHMSRLTDHQKERIIRNYVDDFEAFHAIDLIDRSGTAVATSRIVADRDESHIHAAFEAALQGETYRSNVYISKKLTPRMVVAHPYTHLGEVDGAVIGEINLIDMWTTVDEIRIGREGRALVVSRNGQLIAHGQPRAKPHVLKQKNLMDLEIIRSVLQGETATAVYASLAGDRVLAVGAPVKGLGWGIVIEQPVSEAYLLSNRMTRRLLLLIGIFLAAAITLGTLGGRVQIVRPIRALMEGTRRVASGDLSHQVTVRAASEFTELADSFNLMTVRLAELQEEIKEQERSATFGRLAAGLVHDLRHPVANLDNVGAALFADPGGPDSGGPVDNPEVRARLLGVIQRETGYIQRVLSDLHGLTHPAELQLFSLDVNSFIRGVAATFEETAAARSIQVELELAPNEPHIRADTFALERVCKNLISNAFEAMQGGGRLRIITAWTEPGSNDGRVSIAFEDSGVGIPEEKLKTIFDIYNTSKPKGLGLGLAVCRKLVDELGGKIEIQSTPGRGTTMTLLFPFDL